MEQQEKQRKERRQLKETNITLGRQRRFKEQNLKSVPTSQVSKWAVIVPHCGAGYGVGGGAAQRAEAAKGNEYFICRLLVLTIDGKQGYPAAQLAAVCGGATVACTTGLFAACCVLYSKEKK